MMTKVFVFTIHAYGKMNDGKRVVNVAKNGSDAMDNVRVIYPGYCIVPV